MIVFGIIWATLGLIGFFLVSRWESDRFPLRIRDYIVLIPAWALIGPLGLYGLWVFKDNFWEWK
jgi:hypothetical protein